MPLCPASSDVNLLRNGKGIIDLDAEVSDSALDLGVISLRQRIRSQGEPGQDGDPRVLVLIKRSGSQGPISHSRFPERRSTVRPSHFHHPQTSSAVRAGSARLADPLSYDAVAAFMSNFLPLRITAQAIRASLAASATTTVFTCARPSRPRNHAPNGVSPLDSVGRAARAP